MPRLATPTRPSRLRALAISALVFAAAALAIWPSIERYLRAAAMLASLDPATTPRRAALLSTFTRPVDETALELQLPSRRVRAILYEPRGQPDAPALVLVHGVHHLGIAEPRLVRFARAFAAAGVAVLTPEMIELAEYQVVPATAQAIGETAVALRDRRGVPVSLAGLSFAGGLSLLASADGRFAPAIRFVLAIGAYDDLGRVLRFFVDDQVEEPDGSRVFLRAHEYGPTVLVAAQPEAFFAPSEVEHAREALRLWLSGHEAEGRTQAARLSPEARALVRGLFEVRTAQVSTRLAAALPALAGWAASVSPAGHLAGVRCPVILLHGSGDNVIPAAETRWLARDLPRGTLRTVLVSPAIVHAELGEVTARDQWKLVHAVAEALLAAGA